MSGILHHILCRNPYYIENQDKASASIYFIVRYRTNMYDFEFRTKRKQEAKLFFFKQAKHEK